MKINALLLCSFTVSSTLLQPVHASELKEMNTRKTIDNTSMNKIMSARLRGLLAGELAQRKMGKIGQSDGECGIQIGNSAPQTSLVEASQDIIIVGDTINFCQ